MRYVAHTSDTLMLGDLQSTRLSEVRGSYLRHPHAGRPPEGSVRYVAHTSDTLMLGDLQSTRLSEVRGSYLRHPHAGRPPEHEAR